MQGRKIAITGAGRGLGKALAIAAADVGAVPLLLGRSREVLDDVAQAIAHRTGKRPDAFVCDLADLASVAEAVTAIARRHPDLDALVNNGSQWTGGDLQAQSDESISAVVGSTVTGTIAITRGLLPILRTRPWADVHTVVSMSGLQFARSVGASLPFRSAKAAQDGFVQGLVEELWDTNVRVTSVYPGVIKTVSPLDADWTAEATPDDRLTDKNVVEAILFALSAPPNVSVRQLVIESTRTDFLR